MFPNTRELMPSRYVNYHRKTCRPVVALNHTAVKCCATRELAIVDTMSHNYTQQASAVPGGDRHLIFVRQPTRANSPESAITIRHQQKLAPPDWRQTKAGGGIKVGQSRVLFVQPMDAPVVRLETN
jgi:hypothetical protein